MKKMCLLVAAALLVRGVFAVEPWRDGEREPLWPEGRIPDFQAHQVARMTDELASTNAMPYLEWFAAPTNANGACMILVSGGSYQNCCDLGLIKLWRETFTARGYQTVNLVYRTPRPQGLPIHQSAWQDAQRAVRLVRSEAAKRGYGAEKIGVIGMSAGGHLTCLMAANSQTRAYAAIDEIDNVPCHINWAIANAPAYNTSNGKTGVRTPEDGLTIVPTISDVLKFDEKTCPISFHHGGVDPWSPNGSTLAYRELRKRKIPAELHLYGGRAHGAHGLARALEFLEQLNVVGSLRPEEDIFVRYPNDDARASYEKQAIWPEGKTPDRQEEQCEPYLEWHMPKELKTKAIQIVYSGGSYKWNSPDSFEVAPVRRYLNAKGMAVVTVKYRMPRPNNLPKHQTAWQDLQRAIRLVRSQAEAKGLDGSRIGIMGASAGGHLTLMGALSSMTKAYEPIDELDAISPSVQWAVAIYPAYALTDGADAHNTTGGNDDSAVLVPEFKFDEATAPVLFIHGDADHWAAMNSVKCWEKLRSMGVQGDLHTLALRSHCFMHKSSPATGSATWLDRIWEFMSARGFNK